MYEIDIYRTDAGKEPFIEWQDGLDLVIQARVDARLTRIEHTGNLGDCKSLGDGVHELRFDFDPGYRVYFGKVKKSVILLLAGGAKGSQQRDINKAKEYWQDHLSRQK